MTHNPVAEPTRRMLIAIRVGLALIAIPVAVYELGRPSFISDEGASFAIASQHGSAFASALAHDGGNMLFYYAILHAALMAGLSTSPAAIRSLSVLPFIFLGPVVFELGRRLYSTSAGLIAALLVELNADTVDAAHQARSYVFVVLFVSVTFLCLVLDRQRPSARYRLLWLVAAVLAVYCHLLAILPILAQLGWTLIRPPREVRRRMWPYVGAHIVLFLPLLWLAARRGTQQISWIGPLSTHQIGLLATYLLEDGGYGNVRRLIAVVTVLACIIGALRAIRRWTQHVDSSEWGRIGLLLWIVFPIVAGVVISIVRPLLVPNYFIGVVPAIALLAAGGISSLKLRPIPLIAGTGFCVMLAYSLFPSYGQSTRDEQNWQGATAFVLARSSPRAGVVFLDPDGWNTFDYYVLLNHAAAGAPTPVFPNKPWLLITNYSRDPQVPSAAALGCVANHFNVVWLVVSNLSTSAQTTAVNELRNDFAVRRIFDFPQVQLERLSRPHPVGAATGACA
jgi:mannosyltransferase